MFTNFYGVSLEWNFLWITQVILRVFNCSPKSDLKAVTLKTIGHKKKKTKKPTKNSNKPLETRKMK